MYRPACPSVTKTAQIIPALAMVSVQLVCSAIAADQQIISINFSPSADDESSMKATDRAGFAGAFVGNWNNVVVESKSGTVSELIYNNGKASGATVHYISDLGGWKLPITVKSRHDRMWKGYLDAHEEAKITISGLKFSGAFRIIVYSDGDNQTSWNIGTFTIGDLSRLMEDSENTNWGQGANEAKAYQLPVPGHPGNIKWPTKPSEANNSEGNMIVFGNLTGDSVTLTLKSTNRVVVNGLQLVGHQTKNTEPTSTIDVTGGGPSLILRRKTSE